MGGSITMRAALLIVVATVAGCRTAPAASHGDPVGCWYFEQDAEATALNLPWGVRLAGDALGGFPALAQRGDARVARTLEAAGEAAQPFGYWLPIEGDSIEIGYPAGGGLVLRVARGDTSMQGSARAVGDVVAPGAAPRPVRSVRLTRAQCPTY